jgi:hypothetical protein
MATGAVTESAVPLLRSMTATPRLALKPILLPLLKIAASAPARHCRDVRDGSISISDGEVSVGSARHCKWFAFPATASAFAAAAALGPKGAESPATIWLATAMSTTMLPPLLLVSVSAVPHCHCRRCSFCLVRRARRGLRLRSCAWRRLRGRSSCCCLQHHRHRQLLIPLPLQMQHWSSRSANTNVACMLWTGYRLDSA